MAKRYSHTVSSANKLRDLFVQATTLYRGGLFVFMLMDCYNSNKIMLKHKKGYIRGELILPEHEQRGRG